MSNNIIEPVVFGKPVSKMTFEEICAAPCPVNDNMTIDEKWKALQNGFVSRNADMPDFPKEWYVKQIPTVLAFQEIYAANDTHKENKKEEDPNKYDLTTLYFEPGEMFLIYLLNGDTFTLEDITNSFSVETIKFMFDAIGACFADSSPVSEMFSQILPLTNFDQVALLNEIGYFKKETALEGNPFIASDQSLANEIRLSL